MMKAVYPPYWIVPAALAALLLVPCAIAGAPRSSGSAPLQAGQQGESSSSSRTQDQDQGQSPDQNAGQPAKKGQKSSSKGQSAPEPAPPPSANGDDPISIRINNTAKAEHDVEVGRYYVKKEKYDAAIDRFKEAADLVPTYALPNKLMGEAYEKKRFLPEAAQAYEKYLQIAPKAGDAEDVRKRVARLHAEMQEDERKRAAAAKQQ